jgi:hypothetical protein
LYCGTCLPGTTINARHVSQESRLLGLQDVLFDLCKLWTAERESEFPTIKYTRAYWTVRLGWTRTTWNLLQHSAVTCVVSNWGNYG